LGGTSLCVIEITILKFFLQESEEQSIRTLAKNKSIRLEFKLLLADSFLPVLQICSTFCDFYQRRESEIDLACDVTSAILP
jgi:hypothetical protein